DLISDTGNVFQKINRRAIQVHADAVHAGFDDCRETALQFLLIDIMLILPDTDGLWFRLHKLCQWILQTARDGYRASDSDIQTWTLLSRYLRRGIARGAGPVDDDNNNVDFVFVHDRAHKRTRLARPCAVADRDSTHPVLLNEIEQDFFGTFQVLFRLGQMNRL